jgi:hypothetical protein
LSSIFDVNRPFRGRTQIDGSENEMMKRKAANRERPLREKRRKLYPDNVHNFYFYTTFYSG